MGFIYIFFGAVLLLYIILLLYLLRSEAILTINSGPIKEYDVKLSLIAVFRNEAFNLPNFLNSIEAQNYNPNLFEVLLINDHSEDDSVIIIERFIARTNLNIRLIHLNKLSKGKKAGIQFALESSKYDWVLCTDADCILPKNFIKAHANCKFNSNPLMVIGPVQLIGPKSFLSQFQKLDFMGMQAFTAYSAGMKQPLLCNGANLAYDKKIFKELNPYSASYASGDDMFLMNAVAEKYPSRIHYLNHQEAIVKTNVSPDWKSFVQQRLRWGGKLRGLRNFTLILVMSIVFLMHLNLLLVLLLSGIERVYFYLFLVGFLIKVFMDKRFMLGAFNFFRESHLLSLFLVAQFFQIFYMGILGVLSNILPYTWKGRKIRD